MNSNFPLVSVLIPLYNKEIFVAETITSVLNQTYPNIEIIIVDDGSTDKSFDIANSFVSNKVRVFKQANKGASAARNKAFGLSKGDFIQYLDGDDLLHPHKIAEQMKILSDNLLSLSTAHWQYFFDSCEDIRQDEKLNLLRDFNDLNEFLFMTTCHGFPIHAWLIPRLVIEKSKKWDEEISIFDDKDFMMHLILNVDSILFCDSAYCYYRIPQQNTNLSARRDRQALLGGLKHIDNAEKYFSTLKTTDSYRVIACLYKKLLLIALDDKEIINDIKQRSIKLGFAPDCSRSFFIRSSEKIFGIRFTFWLVYFRAKYLIYA
jgi:glycosyltransferase involved in cell wall biosynthesis